MQNSLKPVNVGSIPDEINVIIEIPANSSSVKYKIDKCTGAMFVDHLISTPMFYPCNYGFVPETLSNDSDPADVLVITPYPLTHDSVIVARPIGVLKMMDEAGEDAKILAMPIDKHCRSYQNILCIDGVHVVLKNEIEHFFQYYKDLDEGKCATIEGWGDAEAAKKEFIVAFDNYRNK